MNYLFLAHEKTAQNYANLLQKKKTFFNIRVRNHF